jgi:hypothetical protein
MLNEGTTALPYEPYFSGLRSAPVTEVESVGANLFDGETLKGFYDSGIGTYVNSENESCSKNYISILPNAQYCVTGTQNFVIFYDFNQKFISSQYYNSQPFTTPTNARYMRLNFGTADVNNIMINKGSTALPFAPFTKNALEIPEAVRPENGINEYVYDYIEWLADETRKSYQRVGVSDMGTLDFYKHEESNSWFFAEVPAMVMGGSLVRCIPYDFGTSSFSWSFIDSYADKTINITTNNFIYIKDTAYTDVETFKAAMSGVMLYYELAEPIITDISDKLPADNLIAVEGGGSLTFKNEYEFAVPSTVVYQVKSEVNV